MKGYKSISIVWAEEQRLTTDVKHCLRQKLDGKPRKINSFENQKRYFLP